LSSDLIMVAMEVVIMTDAQHSTGRPRPRLHSGSAARRAALSFSPDSRAQSDLPSTYYDVVVIGGGAAGLSAALVLARARRSVMVVDGGRPRNAPASGVHGFLTRDGIPPAELIAAGQAEVRSYGGQIITGEVVTAGRREDGFRVILANGSILTGRRLMITTGLVDELPEIPGLRERWGQDVLHCPYCHGWEFQDQPIGIIATSSWVVHQALLFRQWSADLVVFTHTAPPLAAEQTEQLTARGIRVISGRVRRVLTAHDRLTGVELEDGSVVGRRALVVAPRMVARSAMLAGLGLEPTPHPSGLGEHIAVQQNGQTDVPGVWAAGNVSDIVAQVVGAAAGGVMVAAQINADLVMEETRLAVEASRRALAATLPSPSSAQPASDTAGPDGRQVTIQDAVLRAVRRR
jgi:thioredoxin reductase